jgi:serine/threonine protein kinase
MPSPGDTLKGRYVIREPLGEGGFAVVYRADDTTTGAQVAVKVMDPVMSRRDELAQRFLREVETVSRLRHHHTIKVSDKGETDNGCLFLVMELLEGTPLDTLIEKQGKLQPERVRQIAIQTLKSLSEAHSQGIIHRDLKPANIFLVDVVGEDDDFIKVLDFGIAKSLDDEDAALTSTGQVMCSPHYVAPERVADHVTVPASDLYSLGVMMIELLEGETPYDASTPIQIVLQHARVDSPVPMKEETAKGPLGPIITRAVEKRYAQRYQSARDMLSALQELGPIGSSTASSLAHQETRAADASTHDMPRKPTTVDAMANPSANATDPTLPSGHAAVDGDEQNRRALTPILIAAVLFLVLASGAVAMFLQSGGDNDTSTAEGQNTTASNENSNSAPSQERPIPDTASRITISTSPAEAAIRVGDQFVGTSPVTLPRDSFREYPVEIRAELPSGAARSIVIENADDLGRKVEISFDEDEVAAAEPSESPAADNPQANDDGENPSSPTSDNDEPATAPSPENTRPSTEPEPQEPGGTSTGSSESEQPSGGDSGIIVTKPIPDPADSGEHQRPQDDGTLEDNSSDKPDTGAQQPTPSPIPDRTPLPPSSRDGYSGGGSQGGGSGGGSGGSGGSYFGR